MNMNELEFPCVIVYHELCKCHGATFIMYNQTSAIVIEAEQESPYKVGQVVEGRIGFHPSLDEQLTVVKMPFEITRYREALVKIAKQKQRELDVMNFVLRGCEDEQKD